MTVVHHFDNDQSPQVYAREQKLGAGETIETHAHAYDHLSIGVGGPVEVEVDGAARLYGPEPFCIRILAGKRHRIRAFGDSHWFCIHATSERDISRIEEVLIERRDDVLKG